MTEEQLRFHLEEYKALRAEIASYVRHTFDFFLYAAVASGAIAGWLLTHHSELTLLSPGATKVAAFIPLLVSVLAMLGAHHLIFIVVRTAKYCAKVEAVVAAPGLGWETNLRSDARPSAPIVITFTQNGSWIVLIAADLFFALYL